MAEPTDVVFVTGSDLRVVDPEGPLLCDALAALGVQASIQCWDVDFDWSATHLVVIRSTWDYTRRLPEFLDWLARVDQATTVVNPAEVVRWNSHKGYLTDLTSSGVSVVPTTLLRRGASAAEQKELLASQVGGLVVKPAVSAGAVGVATGDAHDRDLALHVAELAEAGDVLVQPVVGSVTEYGEVSLLFFAGELSHAVRKVPAAGDIRVQEWFGGSVLDHEASDAEIMVARAALTAAPEPVDYARVDLVAVDGEPAVMELELIEPFLFLERSPGSVARFADVLAKRFKASPRRR